MTTLTATPQLATASVALTLTPTGPVTRVLRADSSGIHPVRTQAGQFPTSAPTVLIDNEAAVSGTIAYTVEGGGGAAASTTLDGAGEWLTVPVTPARSQRVELVTDYTATRESLSTVHRILGRPDPVVALAPLALRADDLTLWCPSHAAALALASVYASGEVVLLRQGVPGLDMYHVATRTRITPQSEETTPRRWALTVTYVEVAWPVGDQLGTLGWSVDDVTLTYPTVSALTLAYPTINALTIGPLP